MGNTAAEMVDAVLQLVPLDVEYEAHPIEYMVPDADSGVVLTENKVWDDTIAAVVKHGYDAKCVGQIERTKFYEEGCKGLRHHLHERAPAVWLHHPAEGCYVIGCNCSVQFH